MTFRGRIRVLAAAAAATLALLVIPSSASAAATIGATPTPTSACGADFTRIQSTSPGSQYAAPADGVITEWSFRTAATPPQLKFKVARHVGGNDFLIVGESELESPAANTLNTYRTNIAVQAGDEIGFFNATSGQCSRPDPAYAYSFFSGDPQPGTTGTFGNFANRQLPVSANLETKKCKGVAPTMAGTAGNDTLVGTPGKDVIVGLAGKDRIKGLGGKDKLCGLKGKDRIKGGGGKDKLKGGKGRDRLVGGGGRDKCVGGKGDDVAKKCEVERSI